MRRILFITTFLLFFAAGQVIAQSPRDTFKKFRPMICQVEFYKNIASQAQIGSYIKIKQNRIGILVSKDGLVMVNSDVYPLSLDIISGDGASFASGEPSDFKVKTADGKEYEAEFVGKDERSQVAFISITGALSEPFPFVEFDGTEDLQIGQSVYLLELLGEGYQFEPLFTQYQINAIVTVPRKKILVKDGLVALSAGGLVITEDGKAVGVSLRKDFSFDFGSNGEFGDYGSEFLEIAPSEWFSDLILTPPVLEKTEHKGKAWFGIGMQALTPELKEYWKVPSKGGIVVDRVYPESPAENAGLRVKDVIIAFGEKDVDIKRNEDLNQFRETITQQDPGNTIKLKIFRDGKVRDKKVTLTSAPRAIDLAAKYQLSTLGIEVRELTLDIFYDYDFPLDTKGVYVFQVDRAAPAGLGGLEIGSIITHINGSPIEDLPGFEKTIQEILETEPEKIMFQVQFSRQTEFVFVDGK